jgi:bifunctional non-homologous end joining protein LigD
MLEHACRFGLERIVSKRAGLPYRPGRGDHWIRASASSDKNFSFDGGQPVRRIAGARLQKLVYAGRVGTGWSHPRLSAGRGRGFVRELARHVRGVIAEPGARGSALSSRKRGEQQRFPLVKGASDCHVQVS